MLSPARYAKIFRISAWYDLIVTWPFALAFTFSFMWHSVLAPLNAYFGFPPLHPLGPHAVLFANFFGSVVVVWAVARLYLNDPVLGLFDGFGRLLFSAAMIHALANGASPLIWCFLVPEIGFCALQLVGRPNTLFAIGSKAQEPTGPNL